jgi:uncharacterized protein (UPF0335 family)
MKIVTITHEASGIRINFNGKVQHFDNATYVAEELARHMETVESLENYIKTIRDAVESIPTYEKGDEIKPKLLKTINENLPF